MEFLKKNRMIFIIAGVAVLSVVRMLVLLLGIDPVNGYSNSVLWAVLQIAVCAFALGLTVLPVLFDKNQTPMGDAKIFRVMAGFAAVVFAVHLGLSLVGLWNEFSSAMLVYRLAIPWAAIGKVLLSVLSVGFFFLLCRCGTRLPSNASLLLILGPIGLYMIRLIDDFMTITMNPSVDTYAILLLSGGLALLFLSQLGRVLLDGQVGRGFLAASSAAALLLALSAVAATIFSLLGAPVYQGLIGLSDLLCDLSLMTLALSGGYLTKAVPDSPRRHAMVGSAVPVPRRRGRYIPKH